MDNWFTSIPLFQILLKQHRLTSVGTLRKNKAEIPKEFIASKERKAGSSLFGFTKDMTIVSHIPKKGKVVLLSSTMHHDAVIDPEPKQRKSQK